VVFDFGSIATPGAKRSQALESVSKSSADPRIAAFAKGELAKKTTLVTIADQPSRCIEDIVEIYCIPEYQETGLMVTYNGSNEMKPAFYEMLSKVTRVQHKQ